MIAGFLAKVFGTKNARELRKLQPIVKAINEFEPDMIRLDDEQLAAKTVAFKEQLSQGKTLNDILPQAFAVVREVAKRKLGQRPFDVQLMGGIVLHQGKIAEMKTGEGKTLTATLPLYLNALTGKGVHLVTVNDYLARRDKEWMQPVYKFLGLEVACLQNNMSEKDRKKAYQADILYATNNELGFDYLRDNMKFRLQDYVQRPLFFGIIDEVDSILIDEARTPLIISGSSDEMSKYYSDADRAVSRLTKDNDYELDEKEKSVLLTESGIDKIEEFFNLDNLYAVENMNILHHVKQALKSQVIFKRDVDYVVKDGEVLIVDEFTGRILPGRRYSEGLHQALEAKEDVEIEKETHTLASITLQNYFRLYEKLAGMTGTAVTEAEEFYKIYKLHVVAIPTHKEMIRDDKADFIFLSKEPKYKEIVKDVTERHKKGQPVLIGTVAIETSEYLSSLLKKHGIPHEVLNAKQHLREADIVAKAGEPGQVTIATNMAGRGTDIKLTPESVRSGGLYILGTERHESRRIDNQLRGRSGRQGDVGESRFYLSLEDDLIRRFAGDTLRNRMKWAGMQEDEVIEHPFVSKQIEKAQEKVEKYNFEVRKHLLEYDDVLNQQRKVIYEFRKRVIEGEENILGVIRDLIIHSIQDLVAFYAPTRVLTHEQVDQMYHELHAMTGLPIEDFQKAQFNVTNTDQFKTDVINYLLEQYTLFRKGQDTTILLSAEKWLLLEMIDQAWKQHMVNLDYFKEGIGLRSWGQKNPLIEYKREAFTMFEEMMRAIRRNIVHNLFRMRADQFNQHEIEERRQRELDQMNLQSGISTTPGNSTPQEPRRIEKKVGRNEPCECGSGKKFKKCCGKKARVE
jgi:preprotein translocase subunit SecA